MLSAVQIFNNPNVVFKSEIFVVLTTIAWTYLLHSYFKKKRIEYRYYEQKQKRRKFDKTKRGSFKYWELERCLNDENSPVDDVTGANLRFLVGLRHEIEHQMTTRIDDFLSARFQASCLNFNEYVKKLFGKENGIDRYLSFSLQFSSITEDHAKQLRSFSDLPKGISAYINDFDDSLSEDEFNNPHYSYRVLYVPKIVNHRGQADKVIEFISAESQEAQGLNKEYRIIRDREKPKHLPSDIVKAMKAKGYGKFGMHQHTVLWKVKDARNPSKGLGVLVANTWYWYDSWLSEVEKHCKENSEKYVS